MTPRAHRSARVLVALLLPIVAACTGSTSDTGGSAGPEPSLRGTKVQGLSLEQPVRWAADASNWTVSLTWDPVSGPVDHYEVRRDGIVVSASVESPPFDDGGVAPGNSYRYEVRAIDAEGTASRPAMARFRMETPPLDQARFRGMYVVRMTPTDWNTTQKPQAGRMEFFFDPRCPKAEGACDVTWQNEEFTARGVLERDGLTYRGTVHGRLLLGDCHGNRTSETLEIELKVLEAAGHEDEWNVSRFEGPSKRPGIRSRAATRVTSPGTSERPTCDRRLAAGRRRRLPRGGSVRGRPRSGPTRPR
ncbi:MAG: hypothetical protein ACXWFU_11170 [Actinomycetota bacterium]